jgi:hypothetical protein
MRKKAQITRNRQLAAVPNEKNSYYLGVVVGGLLQGNPV